MNRSKTLIENERVQQSLSVSLLRREAASLLQGKSFYLVILWEQQQYSVWGESRVCRHILLKHEFQTMHLYHHSEFRCPQMSLFTVLIRTVHVWANTSWQINKGCNEFIISSTYSQDKSYFQIVSEVPYRLTQRFCLFLKDLAFLSFNVFQRQLRQTSIFMYLVKVSS